jgi:ribosomal protein S6
MVETNRNPTAITLEEGDIFFLYRPKVEEENPKGEEDVQRFYMVLRPKGGHLHRLMVIGRKRLPDPNRAGRERFWGFVEQAAAEARPIAEELKEQRYSTKTRGERRVPAARPAGEGVYRIVRHGRATHLIYALELPKRTGEVQDELNIEEEASYVLSVKNPMQSRPDSGTERGAQDVRYPPDLQSVFRDRRFSEADPVRLLDYEGAEFLLVAAGEDAEEETGVKLHPQDETPDTADIFRELRLERSRHPAAPLFKGYWQ